MFQPGLFLDYLASPYKTAKYVTPLDTFIDFQKRRAIVVEGHEDAVMTLTTVHDIARVVARAVDIDDEWPKVGGIKGNSVTISQILHIGETVRGKSRPVHHRKSKVDRRLQVALSLLIKSNSKILRPGISSHRGIWVNATQALLRNKPISSRRC